MQLNLSASVTEAGAAVFLRCVGGGEGAVLHCHELAAFAINGATVGDCSVVMQQRSISHLQRLTALAVAVIDLLRTAMTSCTKGALTTNSTIACDGCDVVQEQSMIACRG